MARKYVDCRQFPSETKCTVTISADSEKELMGIAVQHAVAVHGHWKLHRERGRGPLTTGIRIFNHGPKLKVRNIAFSAEKAEGIACKIAATNLRLVVWTMRNIPDRR